MDDIFEKYFWNNFIYLSAMFIFIFILFLFGIALYVKNKSLGLKILSLSLFLLTSAYLYLCVIQFPVPKNLNISSDKDNNYTTKGTWCRLKFENDKVFKKWYPVITEKENKNYLEYYHGFLKPFVRLDNNNKLPLLVSLYWTACMAYQWRSIKRREHLSKKCKYLAKIENVDHKDCSWSEEYVKNSLPGYNNLDKIKFQNQMKELDNFLKKNDYYIVDLHHNNLMITEKGDIKIIDGEVVTKKELDTYCIFYKYFRGYSMIPIKNMERLYWSAEPGRVSPGEYF